MCSDAQESSTWTHSTLSPSAWSARLDASPCSGALVPGAACTLKRSRVKRALAGTFLDLDGEGNLAFFILYTLLLSRDNHLGLAQQQHWSPDPAGRSHRGTIWTLFAFLFLGYLPDNLGLFRLNINTETFLKFRDRVECDGEIRTAIS